LARLAKNLDQGPGIFAEPGHTDAAYIYRSHGNLILYL
jgi:hypothetical protein